jgi:transcription antitermination factor NusG
MMPTLLSDNACSRGSVEIPEPDTPGCRSEQTKPPGTQYPMLHSGRKSFAPHTVPQNERPAVKHLEACQIESFLPAWDRNRVWKNRQRVITAQTMFPSCLFVRIHARVRLTILSLPGVVGIIGNSQGPSPIPDSVIEFLRSDFCQQRIEPYRDPVVGEKVRIRHGAMQRVQYVLARKNCTLRLVTTLEISNQHAAVEENPDELEPAPG